ncbi:protein of unknown function [Burkholderia multivorans]
MEGGMGRDRSGGDARWRDARAGEPAGARGDAAAAQGRAARQGARQDHWLDSPRDAEDEGREDDRRRELRADRRAGPACVVRRAAHQPGSDRGRHDRAVRGAGAAARALRAAESGGAVGAPDRRRGARGGARRKARDRPGLAAGGAALSVASRTPAWSRRFGRFRFEHSPHDQVHGGKIVVVAPPVHRLVGVGGDHPAVAQADERVDDRRVVAAEEARIRERQLFHVEQRAPAQRADSGRMRAASQAERPLRGPAHDALQIDDRPLRGAFELDGVEARLLGIESGWLEHRRLTEPGGRVRPKSGQMVEVL